LPVSPVPHEGSAQIAEEDHRRFGIEFGKDIERLSARIDRKIRIAYL